MHEITVFCTKHDDPVNIEVLIKLLPFYKKMGTERVFYEFTSDIKTIEDTISSIEIGEIQILELFSQEVKADSKLTRDQQVFINTHNISFEEINRQLRDGKRFYEIKKLTLELIKQVKSNGMQLINIDGPSGAAIDESTRNPAAIEPRNLYMFQQIKRGLPNKPSKSLLISGMGHLYNAWYRTIYVRSLLHFLREDRDIRVKTPACFIYSRKDQITNQVRSAIEYSHPVVKNIFKEIEIVRSKESVDCLVKSLEDEFLCSEVTPEKNNNFQRNLQEYRIQRPPQSEFEKHLIRYLKDIGAEVKVDARANAIVFVIDSGILTKGRREILGLDRVLISPLSDEGLRYLTLMVPGITIERTTNSSNVPKWLLTFIDYKNPNDPNDSNRKQIEKAIDLYPLVARTSSPMRP